MEDSFEFDSSPTLSPRRGPLHSQLMERSQAAAASHGWLSDSGNTAVAAAAGPDMTSAMQRYKLRACLTCLAQVRQLLRDIQANPDALSVHEAYDPLRSLGEEDEPAGRDVLTTPRPLRNPLQPRLHSPAATSTAAKRGHFGDANDLFPSDSALSLSELGGPGDEEGEEEEEDGRFTAFHAVAMRAEQDPRFATIQGLLQHIDQLTLEGDATDDSAATTSQPISHTRTAQSYPAWLLPQISQVFATLNSLYPTPARRRADLRAKVRAEEFRKSSMLAAQERLQAQEFESFLASSLQQARDRHDKLQELSALKKDLLHDDDGDEASQSSVASKRKGGAAAPANDDDDPFASLSQAAADLGDESAGANGDEDNVHDERARLDRQAAHLRTLSPRSRKAFLHAQAQAKNEMGGSLGLKDKTHRPPHAKPFGYASHKKKKIGDPVPDPPPTSTSKYAKAPRSTRAAGLYQPRKVYAIPVNHPQTNEQPSVKNQSRQHEEEKENHENAEQQEEEEDDPFACHDPDASAAASSAPVTPVRPSGRSSSVPSSAPPARSRNRATEEEKEQESSNLNSHRPAALSLAENGDDDDDDPFASHDPDAAPRSVRPAPYSAKKSAAPRRAGAPAFAAAAVGLSSSRSSAHTAAGASSAATPAASLRLSSTTPVRFAAQHAAAVPRTVKSGQRNMSPPPTTKRQPGSATAAGAQAKAASPPPTRKRPSAPPSALSTADFSSAPIAAAGSPRAHDEGGLSSSLTLTSPRPRGLFGDEGDPASWQDIELKLQALNEEVLEQRASTQKDVKKEVQEALKQLMATNSFSFTNTGALGNANRSEAGEDPLEHTSSDHVSESGDMSTLAWDNALNNAFAKGKKIIRVDTVEGGLEEEAATGGSVSAAQSTTHKQSQPSRSPSSRDLLSATLASAQSELCSQTLAASKLAEEKRGLEAALAVLQARDAAHAQSLFQLMDKLNGLNGANNLGMTLAMGPNTQQNRVAMMQSQRAQLATAAFIHPFGSPDGFSPGAAAAAAAAASVRRSYPLGTAEAHGLRSLHVPSPEEIALQASWEEPAVQGLPPIPPPAPASAPRGSLTSGGGENSQEETTEHAKQERQAQELRLMELEQRLSVAQASNVALREKLDSASFQSAVLSRTAEAQKLFLAQTLAQQSDSERIKEQARLEVHAQQHREDARKLQQSESTIQSIREEQRMLQKKLEADRAASESTVQALDAEVALHVEEKRRLQTEMDLMRLRLSQLQDEQRSGGASAGMYGSLRNTRASRMSTPRAGNGRGLFAPGSAFAYGPSSGGGDITNASVGVGASPPFAADGSILPQVGSDFVALLTASFRGDYLKLRHNAGLMHTLGVQASIAHATLAPVGAVGGSQEDEPTVEEVVFSDYVTKFNRRNAGQPRVVALTQAALYVLQGPKALQLRRRFALCDLTKVSISRLCTDLIVLHHATEHDLLLTSPKRSELLYHLQRLFPANASLRPGSIRSPLLPCDLCERLYVRDRDGRVRDVQVLDSQSFKIGKAFELQGPAHAH